MCGHMYLSCSPLPHLFFLLLFFSSLDCWFAVSVVSGLISISLTPEQIQRNLQLRIEEQGRYLQKMFEKQCKSGVDKLKTSATTLENPSTPSLDTVQESPAKSEQDASQVDHGKTGTDPVNANTALEESSQELGGKHKVSEANDPENSEPDACESSSQPSKRPRTDE